MLFYKFHRTFYWWSFEFKPQSQFTVLEKKLKTPTYVLKQLIAAIVPPWILHKLQFTLKNMYEAEAYLAAEMEGTFNPD